MSRSQTGWQTERLTKASLAYQREDDSSSGRFTNERQLSVDNSAIENSAHSRSTARITSADDSLGQSTRSGRSARSFGDVSAPSIFRRARRSSGGNQLCDMASSVVPANIRRSLDTCASATDADRLMTTDSPAQNMPSSPHRSNSIDSDEDSLPGAYAVTRVSTDDGASPDGAEWDPTEQENTDDIRRNESDDLTVMLDSSGRPVVDACVTTKSSKNKERNRLYWFVVIFCAVSIIAVGVTVGVLLSTEKDHSDQTENPVIDLPDCDFAQETSPNPFLQCECYGTISKVSKDVYQAYHDIMVLLLDYLKSQELAMDMCIPENIALLWLAWEKVMHEVYYTGDRLITRFALSYLFAAWEGQQWTNSDNWLNPDSECSWYGVTCDNQGRVISVEISLNGLKGVVESNLNLLSHLKVLNLSSNGLQGSIPSELFQLRDLEELLLDDNQMTGFLPPEIGFSDTLERLSLAKNGLDGTIPRSISLLLSLRELNLSENIFDGTIPSDIGNLTKLEYLDLSYTSISGQLPVSMGFITDLKSLRLVQSGILGPVMSVLSRLTSLEMIELAYLELDEAILPDIGRLTQLTLLNALSADLTGPIPSEIGLCTGLVSLFLSSNLLTATLPKELGRLTSLEKLDLASNAGLSGTVPIEYSSLTNLTFINVANTDLTGTIPSDLCLSSGLIVSIPDGVDPCSCCSA